VSASAGAVRTTPAGITGAGVTWTRVRRSSTFVGTAEIWTATTSAPLTNATVTSTLTTAGDQMVTVMAIPPASGFSPLPAIGANAAASGTSTTATVPLTTTRVGSLFMGVGHDPTGSLTHTVNAPQVRLQQWLDTGAADTMWLQGVVAALAGTVNLQAVTTSSHAWDFSGVEVYSP
jgi:hypothetical protein